MGWIVLEVTFIPPDFFQIKVAKFVPIIRLRSSTDGHRELFKHNKEIGIVYNGVNVSFLNAR